MKHAICRYLVFGSFCTANKNSCFLHKMTSFNFSFSFLHVSVRCEKHCGCSELVSHNESLSLIDVKISD